METPISLIESHSPSDAYHVRNESIIQLATRRLQMLYWLYLKSQIVVCAKLFMLTCRLATMLAHHQLLNSHVNEFELQFIYYFCHIIFVIENLVTRRYNEWHVQFIIRR